MRRGQPEGQPLRSYPSVRALPRQACPVTERPWAATARNDDAKTVQAVWRSRFPYCAKLIHAGAGRQDNARCDHCLISIVPLRLPGETA